MCRAYISVLIIFKRSYYIPFIMRVIVKAQLFDDKKNKITRMLIYILQGGLFFINLYRKCRKSTPYQYKMI